MKEYSSTLPPHFAVTPSSPLHPSYSPSRASPDRSKAADNNIDGTLATTTSTTSGVVRTGAVAVRTGTPEAVKVYQDKMHSLKTAVTMRVQNTKQHRRVSVSGYGLHLGGGVDSDDDDGKCTPVVTICNRNQVTNIKMK